MNVLIVEDEYITGEFFSQFLRQHFDCKTSIAHSKQEAIAMVEELKPSVVFMDIAMETKTAGIEACREIKARFPHIKVYMVSAYTEEIYQEELRDSSYNGFIDKTSFTKEAHQYLS